MNATYNPQAYWEERLQYHFNLSGVGHLSYSESYNAWLYRRKANALAKVLDGVDLTGTTVLDIGSGTGFFVREYVSHGALVHGVDITSVSVKRLADEFPQCRFTQADIAGEGFELDDQAFDLISIWDVLYHIVDDEAFARALRNIVKLSHPGTRLILTDALGAPEPINVASHVTLRNLASYQRHLPPFGFQLKAIVPLYYYLNDMRQPDNERRAPEYFEKDEALQLISATNLSLGYWARPAL
jgi:SAM-dependent methyltransferase